MSTTVNYYYYSVYKLLVVNLRMRKAPQARKKKNSDSGQNSDKASTDDIDCHASQHLNQPRAPATPTIACARLADRRSDAPNGLKGSSNGIWQALFFSVCGQAHAYPQYEMCETGGKRQRRFFVQLCSRMDTALVQRFKNDVNP